MHCILPRQELSNCSVRQGNFESVQLEDCEIPAMCLEEQVKTLQALHAACASWDTNSASS